MLIQKQQRMVNKMTFDMYKCKTCKENCKYSPDSGQAYCLVDDKWELRENVKMINNFTQEYGCASHSDFQSERDTCPQNKIWQHCPAAEQIRKQEREKK